LKGITLHDVNINYHKADIVITEIHEEIPGEAAAPEEAGEEPKTTITGRAVGGLLGEGSLIWTIIIILVIVVIIVIVYYKKKKRMPGEQRGGKRWIKKV
jgi:hypothetical protein